MKNNLMNKVLSCLYGGAIGDAMGGPVEMWEVARIIELYGYVDTLLPYDHVEPNPHGPWRTLAGTYTDDTRLAIIAIDMFIEKRRVITRGDFKAGVIKSYYTDPAPLNKDFLEEYMNKAIYENEKEAFGGRPTNGGVMAAPAMGIMCAMMPEQAYNFSFDTLFMSTGYGRCASSLCASAIAAGFIPNVTTKDVVEYALNSADKAKNRVEGPLWRDVSLYEYVGTKVEDMVRNAFKIGQDNKDDFASFRDKLLPVVIQDFKPNGAETCALAFGCLGYSEGNFNKGVSAAVNIGRDNDSTAGIVGAILGAMTCDIPKSMIEQIDYANPIKLSDKANKVYDILMDQISEKEEFMGWAIDLITD